MNGANAQKTAVLRDVPEPADPMDDLGYDVEEESLGLPRPADDESWELPEPVDDESWELPEVDVPESAWHDAIIEHLKLLLRAWADRAHVNALIASNLAFRFRRDKLRVGVDPDVAVYIPPPPRGEDTASVSTWLPGHTPPRIAVEVVSPAFPKKDYLTKPSLYGEGGTTELWVFDPKRLGPKSTGGPFVLQVWRRDEAGEFRRIYGGSGPFKSPEMGAWLVVTNKGKRLRLADDPKGARLWLTSEESAEQERRRAEQERKRAEKRAQSLEGEVSELRAEIERLRNRA